MRFREKRSVGVMRRMEVIVAGGYFLLLRRCGYERVLEIRFVQRK